MMLEIKSEYENNEILLLEFNGYVTIEDIQAMDSFISPMVKRSNRLILAIHTDKSTTVKDPRVFFEANRLYATLTPTLKSINYIGLASYQQFLLKLSMKLSNSEITRKMYPDMQSFEEEYGVHFSKFIRVFKNNRSEG